MNVLSFITNTLALVITFGLAVFVHEFGHMIFALVRGVGVESFAIGMGPKITAWTWRGIEFSLRWFPVGGFVKLQGMMREEEMIKVPETKDNPTPESTPAELPPDEEAKTLGESAYDDLNALHGKGLLTKIMVFGGGVFMNLLAAIAAMALLMMTIGIRVPKYDFNIGEVAAGSAPAVAGFRTGDRVVALDGKPIRYINDVNNQLDLPNREGEKLTFTLTVEGADGARRDLAFRDMATEQVKDVMDTLDLRAPALIGPVTSRGPADRAGLKQGDLVVAANGQPIRDWSEMVKVISANPDKPISLEVMRGAERKTFEVTPMKDFAGDIKQGRIGIEGKADQYEFHRITNPLKVAYLAPAETIHRLVVLAKAQVRFFKVASMKEVRENLGGPIAIGMLTLEMKKRGLDYSINFFITLNLLLLMFNLLPLPVLDGGFILLSIIESAIGRPVPPKVLTPIYTFFVIVFIGLMVLISWFDVQNWFLS